MILELIIGAITALIIIEYFVKKRREEAFKKAGIVGPKTVPLLGNSLLTLNNSTSRKFKILQYYLKDINIF